MATLIVSLALVPFAWVFLEVSEMLLARRNRLMRCWIFWFVEAFADDRGPDFPPVNSPAHESHENYVIH